MLIVGRARPAERKLSRREAKQGLSIRGSRIAIFSARKKAKASWSIFRKSKELET